MKKKPTNWFAALGRKFVGARDRRLMAEIRDVQARTTVRLTDDADFFGVRRRQTPDGCPCCSGHVAVVWFFHDGSGVYECPVCTATVFKFPS